MVPLKRWLAVVVAVALAFLTHSSAQAAPASEALTKAATYLTTTIGSADHLTSDFGNESITADAVLGLAAAHDPANDAVVKRLLDYLETQAKAYTAKSPEGAAKLALVALATGGDATSFGGVDLLSKVTGGIGKDGAFGAFPGAFAQSLGIIALSRAGQQVPEAMITWLLAQQGKDGGFGYAKGKPSDADNTGMAAIALAALPGDAATAALQKAVAWATKNQAADGSWAGYVPVNSTAVMGMGLIAAKSDPTKALDWLAGQQLADGALPNAGKPDVLATAQGMLLLAGQTYLSVSSTAEAEPATSASAAATASPAASASASPAPTTAPAGVPAWLWIVVLALVAGGGALVLARRAKGRS